MKIYLIPGLGFDNRIYERIAFEGAEIEYLNWVDPLDHENLEAYAKRFSERIKTDPNEVILIGHSFGGIVAQEIAAFLPVKKVILISCIKSRRELPFHFKIVQPLGLHRIFTRELTLKTIKYWGKHHGYVSEMEQNLVKDMVSNHSNQYLKWALKELSVWKEPSQKPTCPILHIHGENDKTFPINLIQEPYFRIPKASHFMVYKQAHLIGDLISKGLSHF